MNITVYLGASKGNDNTLANAVRELCLLYTSDAADD